MGKSCTVNKIFSDLLILYFYFSCSIR